MSRGRMNPLTTKTASPAQFANALRKNPVGAWAAWREHASGVASGVSSYERSALSSECGLPLTTGHSVCIPSVHAPREGGEGSEVGARHLMLPRVVGANRQHAFQAHPISEHMGFAFDRLGGSNGPRG